MFSFCIWCFGVMAHGEVTVQRDIPYGDHERQVYDIFHPDNPNGMLVVIVHGGGWAKGDKSGADIWKDKAAHWAPQGITLAAINYRFVPEVTPLEQAFDVGLALRHLRADYDFDRLVLIGHSAGAHLVLLLHTHRGLRWDLKLHDWDATISLDTSAVDVAGIMSGTPYHTWRTAFGTDPQNWLDYSPLLQLKRPGPPILMVCSAFRKLPCAQAEKLAGRGKPMAQSIDVLPVPMKHLSINDQLGQHGAYTAQIDQWIARHVTAGANTGSH